MTDARLDRLTREVTACDGWEDFKRCMIGGYTPTLRPQGIARTNSERTHDRKIRQLAAEVIRRGFQVYLGGGKFGGKIGARNVRRG